MPAKHVNVLPQAKQDVDEAAVYLSQEANVDTAIRFLDAALQTFDDLLDMPGMGKSKPLNNPDLAALRQWFVSDFDNYLIFYREVPTGIEIVRVLHGARNIARVLERETDAE